MAKLTKENEDSNQEIINDNGDFLQEINGNTEDHKSLLWTICQQSGQQRRNGKILQQIQHNKTKLGKKNPKSEQVNYY